jgi:hypothetical protein
MIVTTTFCQQGKSYLFKRFQSGDIFVLPHANSLLGGALEYQDRLPVFNRCARAAYLVRGEFRIVWHYHKSCTQNLAYVNG